MTTIQIQESASAPSVRAEGALVQPRIKGSPERRFPEALAALKAFGHDPAELLTLLEEYDSLWLSLSSGYAGKISLHLVCDGVILASTDLGGLPDYWAGMAARIAARKAGLLPV